MYILSVFFTFLKKNSNYKVLSKKSRVLYQTLQKPHSVSCNDPIQISWTKLKLNESYKLQLNTFWLHNTPLIEDDPSSFYFDKGKVLFNCEETRYIDVNDINDTKHNLSDSFDEED